jgi:glycosyltransferase involved in cell wall biosynthesis
MRVCLVYDCLYPYTVGGLERWYRSLAEAFAARGHDVTYVTRRQWSAPPVIQGVQVVAVSPGGPLYTESGRRRIVGPLLFGFGVLKHLLHRRDRYDVVQCSSFPYFSLLAARLALLGSGVRLGVDWLEVWSRKYWREYLGAMGGAVGYRIQRLCVRATPMAFALSDLGARRLVAEGYQGQPIRLSGLASPNRNAHPVLDPPEHPLALYVGRHIPEKRVDLVPQATAIARRALPELRALILGDGPERVRVRSMVERLNLAGVVEMPGFVPADDVEAAYRRATCLVLPSAREGYGLVVVEAASAGTPTVVVETSDNAAVELIEPGVNGFIVPDGDVDGIAAAIVETHKQGSALRLRTAQWFLQHADRLSVSASAEKLLEAYGA